MNNTTYVSNSNLQQIWANEMIGKYDHILRSGNRLLDLGSGPGNMTAHLYDMFSNLSSVTGLEYSKTYLELANVLCQNRKNLQFIPGNIKNFQFDDKFDRMYSSCVFHWVPDQKVVLQNCYDNLMHGGYLMFCVPGYEETNLSIVAGKIAQTDKWNNIFQDFVNNKSYHSLDEYVDMATSIGFSIDDKEYTDTYTYFNTLDEVKDWIRPISLEYEYVKDPILKEDFLNDMMIHLMYALTQTNDGRYVLKANRIIMLMHK